MTDFVGEHNHPQPGGVHTLTDYRVEFDALRADLLKLANRCDRIRETWEITRSTDEYALGRFDMATLLGEHVRDILTAAKAN